MKEKNYDEGLTSKVFDYYIKNNVGQNENCKNCRELSKRKGHHLINGPIPVFHIGKEYSISRIRLLFLGTVAYGWGKGELQDLFFDVNEEIRATNKLETIEFIEDRIEKLFFALGNRMKFFTYLRESSINAFGDEAYSKIAISNLLKCNSGEKRNHYLQKVFDFCVRPEYGGYLMKDIELLDPTHIVILSSSWKFCRYSNLLKEQNINVLCLPHPSQSRIKGNNINIWKTKIKEFVS